MHNHPFLRISRMLKPSSTPGPQMLALALLLFCAPPAASSQEGQMNRPVKKEVKWFTDSRFGMFIHWTPLGAIDEEIGWSWGHRIPAEKYIDLCKKWNPTRFDADAWVRVAKAAGMKYIVFVPKHHDGFCLWDTRATDFSIMNTPYGRDVCRQLSDACRRQGIAFCTYYSIADLHQNGWSKMCWVEDKTFEPVRGGMDAYFEFVKQQCAELIQKYHTRDFWFDGFWHTQWYGNPQYRKQLYDFIKQLDANVIMARLQMPSPVQGGAWDDGWDFDKNVGDYHSREDHGDLGWQKLYYTGPWEYCSSVAYPNYSYNSKMKYKTSKEMIQTLVAIAGRNGNYLLDMAPCPDGSIDPQQAALFAQIGQWLKQYGASVYGTEGGPYLPIKGTFACTRKGSRIYLHLLDGSHAITLPALDAHVTSARLLGTRQKVTRSIGQGKWTFTFPQESSNSIDNIIEIRIKGQARALPLAARTPDNGQGQR